MRASRYVAASTRKVSGGQHWGIIYWRPDGDAQRETFVAEAPGFRSSEAALRWARERIRSLPAGGPGS